MRIIPTQVHGVVDYLVGLLLIAAPFILDFADGGPGQWVPIVLGADTILYSLMTNYEFGVMKVIPMSTHLIIDLLAGVVLAASPWLFGFSDEVFWPHLILGVFEIVASLMTQTTSEYDDRDDYATGARV